MTIQYLAQVGDVKGFNPPSVNPPGTQATSILAAVQAILNIPATASATTNALPAAIPIATPAAATASFDEEFVMEDNDELQAAIAKDNDVTKNVPAVAAKVAEATTTTFPSAKEHAATPNPAPQPIPGAAITPVIILSTEDSDVKMAAEKAQLAELKSVEESALNDFKVGKFSNAIAQIDAYFAKVTNRDENLVFLKTKCSFLLAKSKNENPHSAIVELVKLEENLKNKSLLAEILNLRVQISHYQYDKANVDSFLQKLSDEMGTQAKQANFNLLKAVNYLEFNVYELSKSKFKVQTQCDFYNTCINALTYLQGESKLTFESVLKDLTDFSDALDDKPYSLHNRVVHQLKALIFYKNGQNGEALTTLAANVFKANDSLVPILLKAKIEFQTDAKKAFETLSVLHQRNGQFYYAAKDIYTQLVSESQEKTNSAGQTQAVRAVAAKALYKEYLNLAPTKQRFPNMPPAELDRKRDFYDRMKNAMRELQEG